MKFLFVLFLSTIFTHQYHISRVDVNLDESSQTIQFTYHFFVDDLELALKNDGAPALKLGGKSEIKESDDYISDYVVSNCTLKIDEKILVPTYIGKEFDKDMLGLYCYFEVELPANYKSKPIELNDIILTSEFEDQKNIVTFLVNNHRIQQFLLDSKNTSCKLSF